MRPAKPNSTVVAGFPPGLEEAAVRVATAVASWNDVVTKGRSSSWRTGHEQEIDGVGFYLLEEEIGHIHLDSSVHVSLPTQVSDALDHTDVVRNSRWAHGQVEMSLEEKSDIRIAILLFRLGYELVASRRN